MSSTYTHTLEIQVSVAGSAMLLQAEVEYGCTPGTPASGPSFDGPGDPGDPPELEVHKVTLLVPDIMAVVLAGQERPTKEVEAPVWLLDFIGNDDDIFRELGDACDWGEDSIDPDYANDLRHEDERMGGLDRQGWDE